MEKKTFKEIWSELPSEERDELAIVLSRKCNSALCTIKAWGLGYRTPRERSQSIVARHLKTQGYETDCKTLFPKNKLSVKQQIGQTIDNKCQHEHSRHNQ